MHLCVCVYKCMCTCIFKWEHNNSVQTPALSSGCIFPIIHIPLSYTDRFTELSNTFHLRLMDLNQWTLTDVAELGGAFMRVCETMGSEPKTSFIYMVCVMKYMAQHIDTTLPEVPLNEYLMFFVVSESRLDFSTAFLLVCCYALSQPSIKASAKQINNAIKWNTFFRQAVGWHGQTLPTCLINRGEKGGPWKQEGNLNLGSLFQMTHMPKVAVSQKKPPG